MKMKLLLNRKIGSHYEGKRFLDIIVAAFGLIMLSPLMASIAIIVWRTLGSPIIFRQIRPGLYCNPFRLIKFRSMTNDRDEYGKLLPNKDRINSFGKFLRNSSLDELPELFNVLRGEMSIVGPRPLLMRYLDRYTKEQMRRHNVRPGITGWAQVNGRNNLAWEDKFDLDLWYLKNQCLVVDLTIILKTFQSILRREGINKNGIIGAEEFKGSKPNMDN